MIKKILIVDDEEQLRKLLRISLEHEGYKVDVACSGREALGAYIESLEENPFELILMDIKMPGLDGRQAMQLIRKEEELRGILYGKGVYIIMLTAVKESWMSCFKEGCDDYVLKPYNDEDLIEKIKKINEEKKSEE